MPLPFHRVVLVALLLNLHSGLAARTKVEQDTVEPSVASHPGPEVGKVTDVILPGAQGAHWPSPWPPLVEALPMMFAVSCMVYSVSCMIYSLWIFGFYGHDKRVSNRLEVIKDHKQEFQKAYDAFTGETIHLLNTLSESVALVAERGFEGKRRHVLSHVRRIREHPEALISGCSSPCAPAFWQLITQWLAVFQECSLRQESASEDDDELPEGATVERAAELACERIESTSASDIARQLESFTGSVSHQDVKALDNAVKTGVFPITLGCGIGCCGIGFERTMFTLISASHAGLLLAFFVALTLAVLEIVTRNWWLAAAVSCASASLLGDFLRYEKVDKMCRAESEVRKLRLQTCAAQRRHEQVNAFYKEVQAVTHLWLHRTTPQLEIYGELFDVLWGPLAGSTDASLLPSVAEKLADMQSGLGPLCGWYGEAAMSVDRLQMIAGTLCACADFIKGQQAEAKAERLPAIIHHLDQMELPISSSEA